MNDLDLCLQVVTRSCQPLHYIRRWISETVRDRGLLVPKDYQLEMAYRVSNDHVTWRHVTQKGQIRDPRQLRLECIISQIDGDAS